VRQSSFIANSTATACIVRQRGSVKIAKTTATACGGYGEYSCQAQDEHD
jgi:hypothetical protein